MKKRVLVAFIVSVGVSGAVYANNTVRFLGEVTDQTCTIKINGTDSYPVVLLPAVSKSELTAAGSSAGQTPFTVTLSGCDVTATSSSSAGVRFVSNYLDGNNLKISRRQARRRTLLFSYLKARPSWTSPAA